MPSPQLKAFKFPYAMSSIVFLGDLGAQCNQPINGAPSVAAAGVSPQAYAYAVTHPLEAQVYIAQLQEEAERTRQYAVTYIPEPWARGATPESVFAGTLGRFKMTLTAYHNSFELVEPPVMQLIETLRNVMFLVPTDGIKQYDARGAKDRKSGFAEAGQPWALHTIEMGIMDYVSLRHQLWHYLDAMLQVSERPFFQKLIGYLPAHGEGAPSHKGQIARHILSMERPSDGKPFYTLDDVPLVAGANAYACWERKQNGYFIQARAMQHISMDDVRLYEMVAMYIQEVVMPAVKWLAEESRGMLQMDFLPHAFLGDCLERVREDVLPELETAFVQRRPVLRDGVTRTATLLPAVQRYAAPAGSSGDVGTRSA